MSSWDGVGAQREPFSKLHAEQYCHGHHRAAPQLPPAIAYSRPMSIEVVFETHALTEDNERGVATGWLPGRLSARGRDNAVAMGRRRRVMLIGHLATYRALEHAAAGMPVEDVVAADFTWEPEGWEYRLG